MENNKSDIDLTEIYETLVSNGDKYSVKVSGYSMYPFLNDGDMVEIEKCQDYNINDVILIRRKDRFIIHRLISIMTIKDNLYYLSKGDNNKFIDRWYKSNLVIGKITKIIKQ